jgi:hypothetical protein
MQVSEVHDHVNHAIIGGKDSIDFGISNSPEFFHILSTSLYRDQMLAVVREVMCNAWDAHIESGLKDTPIEVIITHESFTVRDHGRGIHHDDMGPIYGVYGNSTKKNDGNQTGGFGLGCKSPFAYTDHFEVTSCHEGVKTIYRMSKAVVQADGKPGIVKIASFPTTESGLTVKIDLKNQYDLSRFVVLSERIAFNGEILAKINDKVNDRLGFDSAVRNFHVYSGIALLDNEGTIQIRYGNVIYPVDNNKEIGDLYQEIKDFLQKIAGEGYGKPTYHILFQAPPHSLSVTPSRESLSMQEHTIKTLQVLFKGFIAEMKKTFQTECDNFAQAMIEKAIKEKSYKSLLNRNQSLPLLTPVSHANRLTSFKEMAVQYLSKTYPKDLGFRKADWKCRLMLMVENKMIDRGMASTWLREVDGVTKEIPDYQYRYYSHGEIREASWLTKRVIAPLLGKLNNDPEMDSKRLYLIDDCDSNSKSRGQALDLIPASKASPQHHFYTASYLRNIVVLTKRKKDIHDRVIEHEVFKTYGPTKGYLVYHVGMKQTDADVARRFFAKTNYIICDMIDRQDWEDEEDNSSDAVVQRIAAKLERKPRNKGIPMVSALLCSSGNIDTDLWNSDGIARIDKPEYVIRTYTGTRYNNTSHLDFLDANLSAQFAKLFGDRGGVSTNQIQYDNYLKKKGACTLNAFLRDEVVKYFTANIVEIKNWWAHQPDRILYNRKTLAGMDYRRREILSDCERIPELIDHYKIGSTLSATSKQYVAFYDQLLIKSNADYQPLIDLKKEIDAVSLDPNVDSLLKKIIGCSLANMLRSDELYSTYLRVKDNKTKLTTFISVVTTILES